MHRVSFTDRQESEDDRTGKVRAVHSGATRRDWALRGPARQCGGNKTLRRVSGQKTVGVHSAQHERQVSWYVPYFLFSMFFTRRGR
jgi:hypothetical protein